MKNLVRIFPLAALSLLAGLTLIHCGGGGGGDGSGASDPAVSGTQSLVSWTDQTASASGSGIDLPVAKITTVAVDGGASLTSTSVTVIGTIAAVDDVKVWWNTADDLSTATLVGSLAAPIVGTAYDIPLSGAGNGPGFLFYTISIPSGQNGNYSVTVSSVTGATADNISLPRSTASNGVGFFVTLAADKGSPAALGTVGTVTFTAEANGNDSGGNYDYQFWIQQVPQDGDLWTLVQDYGNGNTWTWTPAAIGSYRIAVWATNIDNASELTQSLVEFEIALAAPVQTVTLAADKDSPAIFGTVGTVRFTAEANGDDSGGNYDYQFWIQQVPEDQDLWTLVQDYGNGNGWSWTPTEPGSYNIGVWAKNAGSLLDEAFTSLAFVITEGNPVPFVTLTANRMSPVKLKENLTITFTAEANGNDAGGDYEYAFWLRNVNDPSLTLVQDFGAANTWVWHPGESGTYEIRVTARGVGADAGFEASASATFRITGGEEDDDD